MSVSLNKSEKKKYLFLHWLGANMASLSMASLMFFYGTPVFWQTQATYLDKYIVANAEEEIQMVTEEPKPEEINSISIRIPKLDASAEVIRDVDPFAEDIYLPALKEGVAQAAGTGLPGEGKRIYLFAHSTNSPLNFTEFNAVFYRLRELTAGDIISVRVNSHDYDYVVREKKVVSADDVSWITPTEGEQLVLQTCDPPGTTYKRLLVISEPI